MRLYFSYSIKLNIYLYIFYLMNKIRIFCEKCINQMLKRLILNLAGKIVMQSIFLFAVMP